MYTTYPFFIYVYYVHAPRARVLYAYTPPRYTPRTRAPHYVAQSTFCDLI